MSEKIPVIAYVQKVEIYPRAYGYIVEMNVSAGVGVVTACAESLEKALKIAEDFLKTEPKKYADNNEARENACFLPGFKSNADFLNK